MTHTDPELVTPVLLKLREAGCVIHTGDDWVRIERNGKRLEPFMIRTEPHPGFPTDMQAQLSVLATLANGTSSITETIFENRFMHMAELSRMGADISLAGNTATVRGVDSLAGAAVMASDLRASAALVIAGLAAEGLTEVLRIYHLDRGYENLVQKLLGVGARIARVSDAIRDPETLAQAVSHASGADAQAS